MNPREAIRMRIKQYCLDCCCGGRKEVKECTLTKCVFHPFRLGKIPKDAYETSVLRIVKLMCGQCTGSTRPTSAKDCSITNCSLHDVRECQSLPKELPPIKSYWEGRNLPLYVTKATTKE